VLPGGATAKGYGGQIAREVSHKPGRGLEAGWQWLSGPVEHRDHHEPPNAGAAHRCHAIPI